MDRQTKEKRVAELSQVLHALPSLVLTEYNGMGVESMTELRRQLRQAGVAYRVIKNTLLLKAAKGSPMEKLAKHLVGPVGIAYSVENDPAAPARVCLEFAKKSDKFKVKAGYAEGEVFDVEGVKALSTLPTKDQMRAMLLSTLIAPAQQFLALCTAAQQQMIGVLSARQAELEKGDAAAA